MPDRFRVGLLHGAGYAGGELIRLLTRHPHVDLAYATSRSAAGQPAWTVHPALRGVTDLVFTTNEAIDLHTLDAIVLAPEHGQGVRTVKALLDAGYKGALVDLSADFRFKDPKLYETWFGYTHPAPELLDAFIYGLPEVTGAYPDGTRWVANPGCFATALTVALWPLSQHDAPFTAHVTALTGASGSGTRPKPTTHFPTRDGNVRAYKVLRHQHLPEVRQALGPNADVQFVPASGPWTRGIWGTAHVRGAEAFTDADLHDWYESAYATTPLVRVWHGELPELRYSVHSPFADVGWTVRDDALVVGFALDNLMKGAASQAVQNLNRLLGLPETEGLLP